LKVANGAKFNIKGCLKKTEHW